MTVEFLLSLCSWGELRESLFLHLLIFKCLQLKIINVPKWQNSGWHALLWFRIMTKMFLKTGVGNEAYICKCIFCLIFLNLQYWKQIEIWPQPNLEIKGAEFSTLTFIQGSLSISTALWIWVSSKSFLSFHLSVQRSLWKKHSCANLIY